ncbi:MAG: hypothetical protein C0614_00375 [Desulfuromonas sp.]|nr:MAG: hypothetical protein C0614_00375 [Desulfuromonas sp.]
MSFLALLSRQVGACVDLLLPSCCLFCSSTRLLKSCRGELCPECHQTIHEPVSACRVCAAPLSSFAATSHSCEACLRKPPPFSRVWMVGSYCDPLKDAIHRLKYRDQLFLSRGLGELLADRLTEQGSPPPFDLVLPVPLHSGRLRQRGYNQALEIARPVCTRTGWPLDGLRLRRLRPTPPQQGLPLAERDLNLSGAFHCQGSLAGSRVLLVDDVMTSGATVRECCRVLKQAGACDVAVAILARA